MTNLAPRNSNEAAAWLTGEQKAGHLYPRECLILQRSARGVPPLAPSAYAAAVMTPQDERIHHIAKFKRGMVFFTKGSNPAGHVGFILGHRPNSDLTNPVNWLTKSNDVVFGHEGQIGVVPLSFYHIHWGHDLLFGATWLNGYDFADFNAKPKPVHPSLGANYEHAMADIKRAIHAHAHDKDDTLENFLKRDLAIMQRRYKRFAS